MFGGRPEYIRAVAAVYEVLLEDVLANGNIGGLDVFLTLIHNQFPELVSVFRDTLLLTHTMS